MLNRLVLERSCQHDAYLSSRGETHANPSSREPMLNQPVMERSCQHDAILSSRGEIHANPSSREPMPT
jgi:hypothetical protein